MSGRDGKPGVMRSLGAFFGEIARAVRSDPDTYDRHEARRRDATPHGARGAQDPQTPADQRTGRIILRRTTTQVDEVELRPEDEHPGGERPGGERT